MKCYLRIDSDYLVDALPHSSIESAKNEYERIARQLENFGQRCEASIHIAKNKNDLQEYPNYLLALGPRGGLRCERA